MIQRPPKWNGQGQQGAQQPYYPPQQYQQPYPYQQQYQQPVMPPQPPLPPEIMARQYHNPHDFQRDQAHLARQGWSVQSSISHQPRSSIGRLIFVPFALLRPPKPVIMVTYQRPRHR